MIEKYFELAILAVCIGFGLFLNKQTDTIKYAKNVRDNPKVKASPTIVRIANENIAKAERRIIYGLVVMVIILLIIGTMKCLIQ